MAKNTPESERVTTPRPPAAPDVVRRKPDPLPLTPLQQQQADALDIDLGSYKNLGPGEIYGLGSEALEAYVYGERTRWDFQGKKWLFLREHVDNAFRLSICCSLGGLVLAEAALPLDRLASKEGEEAVLALVERLSEEAVAVANSAAAYQKTRRTEAEA